MESRTPAAAIQPTDQLHGRQGVPILDRTVEEKAMNMTATLEQLVPPALPGLPDLRLGERAHVARGLMRAYAFQAHNELLFPLVFPSSIGSTREEMDYLRQRIIALYEADYRNVKEGIYPVELTRNFSWRRMARSYLRIAMDAPFLRRRAHKNIFDELPPEAEHYPRYYRRNFHFQHEGYLGSTSAAIYDAQVEVLFGGCADAMRRQILPPLVQELRTRPRTELRLLDVACGTGNATRMIASALPGAHVFGLDLSPHYIAQARRALRGVTPLSLVVENAETMPFRDRYFDAVASVYLFHELPPQVRDRVLQEVARVLKPGGLFVFADSLQLGDAPPLARRLEHFPRQFHEPFYPQYLRDDLPARLRRAGLEPLETQHHLLTKVIVSRRAPV